MPPSQDHAPGTPSPLERLLDLAHRSEMFRGTLRPALEEITPVAADLLDVERVNVWILDDDRSVLRCLDHFDRAGGVHDRGMEIQAADYPAYFDALPRQLALAVEDALHDPRTAGLVEPYLAPRGIGALLDAPVRREGELVGVVCHEHVGGPRSWSDEERYRAGLVADSVAMAMEVRERHALEEKYRHLFDLSLDMVFLVDAGTGRFLETNREAARRLGYGEGELLDVSYRDVHPEEALAEGEAAFRQVVEEGSIRFLSRFVTRDGESFPVEIAAHRLEVEGRRVVQAVARDVSDWVEAQEAIRASERRFRELFERNVAGVFRTTPEGEILDANGAFARILGYDSPDELLSLGEHEVERLFVDASERERLLDRLRAEGSVENYEVRLRRRDGGTVWALENSSLATDQETGRELIEGTLINVTERKRLQEELERMAYHDSLTGLANRRLLRARAEGALKRARRNGEEVGLVYLDLLRFKRVNDTLGHAAGDRVLAETARRLEGAARDSDTVARVGGDEFAVLLPDVDGTDGARRAARRLAAALESSVYVDGEEVHPDARIGVSVFPHHGEDLGSLLTAADAALYQPERSSPRKIHVLEPGRSPDFADELVLEGEIRRAVAGDQLRLFLQPIVRGRDGHVVGAEALIRWLHPERGLLAAREFIHLAERTPLVHELDRWALSAALRRIADWGGHPSAPEWASVNLSAASLRMPELVEWITGEVESHGVEPERLVLEVTERIAVRNPEQVRGSLQALRRRGIRVALDDFGTGHSALAYLHQLPADLLKMDGVFTQGLDRGEDADGHRRVADAIIRLGRAVEMQVAAEKVESEAQRRWLEDAGCDLLQGYHLGEPAPAEELG